MRTIETTIYTFDELSDKAKERAIQAFLSAVKKDIEWQFSDECITESIEANGNEFTENGEIV